MTATEKHLLIGIFIINLPFLYAFLLLLLFIIKNAVKLIIKALRTVGRSIRKTLSFIPVPKRRVSVKIPKSTVHIKLPGYVLFSKIFQLLQRGIQILTKRRLFFVFIIASITASVYLFVTNFIERPYVARTYPDAEQTYTDPSMPLMLIFSKPIKKDSLEVKSVPEIPLDIEYVPLFSQTEKVLSEVFDKEISLPFYKEVRMRPQQSLPYAEKIVFYFTGLENISGLAGSHEHSYEVFSPKEPLFVSASLVEPSPEILPDASIFIDFDEVLTESIAFTMQVSPEAEYKLEKSGDKQIEISFPELLKQGTEYKVILYKKTQIFDYVSSQVVSEDNSEILREFVFKTVNPPGIKEITPSGNKALSGSIIKVSFTEPMDKDSVMERLELIPAIEKDMVWDETNQILDITPKEPLSKATSYSVILKKGIKTLKGGVTFEDITHSFETLGYVKVTGISPGNGSKSTSVLTNIRVDFDQKVNTADAQSRVKVSPTINAGYSWAGNTLVIDPSGNLGYQTKYTITVNSGIKSIDGLDSKDTFVYSFTTHPETTSLNVPRYTQGSGTFDCNIVAARMALAYRGINVSTADVKSGIGVGQSYNSGSQTGGNPNVYWIDSYGTHWDPIANYVRKFRGADVRRNWSLSGIAGEVKNGNPVIIWWYNGVSNTNVNMSWYNTYGAKPGMHSVTVYGFKGPESNPTHILVKDPWFSKETYTASEFNSKWGYFSRTGVVVK